VAFQVADDLQAVAQVHGAAQAVHGRNDVAVEVVEVVGVTENVAIDEGNADVRRQIRSQRGVLGAGNRRGAERSGYRESRSELLHVISPCKVSHWCCREVLSLGSLGSSATGLHRAGWQPGPPVLIVAVPQHAGRNASRFPYTDLVLLHSPGGSNTSVTVLA